MKTTPLEIFPLFRNSEMVKAVYHLYLNEQEYSLTELAQATGCTKAALSARIGPAVRIGIITSRKVGRNTLLSANKESLFYQPLLTLIELTHGPSAILGQELAGLEGIEKAYVYGSWAARISGEPGHNPRDIDVLIIGQPDNLNLISACQKAAERLHREVNPKTVSKQDWENLQSDFLKAISQRPLVEIKMTEASEEDPGSETSEFDYLLEHP